jgi:translation elongation factor EF-Tu-like GTPase
MREFPVIEAEMTFLSKEQGGRSKPFPPNILKTKSYRPHIVIGDVNQREPIMDMIDGLKQILEKYLGVAFCDGPEDVPFDEPIMVKMVLMYFPELSYSEVVPGETFTLREGGSIVGYGQVKAKYTQSFQD